MDAKNEQFLTGQPATGREGSHGAVTTLVTLTIAEGAGEHTHAGAVSRAHQTMFVWLDTTITA